MSNTIFTMSEDLRSGSAQDEGRGGDKRNQTQNTSGVTLTMSALRNQTPVEFVDDPSKPSWDDLPSDNAQDERDGKE